MANEGESRRQWYHEAPNWGQFLVAIIVAIVSGVVAVMMFISNRDARLLIVEERQASVIRRLDSDRGILQSIDNRLDALQGQINTVLMQFASHAAAEDARRQLGK